VRVKGSAIIRDQPKTGAWVRPSPGDTNWVGVGERQDARRRIKDARVEGVVASWRNAQVAARRPARRLLDGYAELMGLTMGERRAVTRATARRYQAEDRAGKKVILDSSTEPSAAEQDVLRGYGRTRTSHASRSSCDSRDRSTPAYAAIAEVLTAPSRCGATGR